jgi:hypothetical protein
MGIAKPAVYGIFNGKSDMRVRLLLVPGQGMKPPPTGAKPSRYKSDIPRLERSKRPGNGGQP